MIEETDKFSSNFFGYFLLFCFLMNCLNAQEGILHKNIEEVFASSFSTNAPGGVILVQKKDKVLFLKSYGLANIETGEKITKNTVFNTGSISKTFVANGILILAEEGKLSLTDRISKYFPDFNHPVISDSVTIKHLLSHTSGLPDVRRVSENPEFYISAKDTANFEPLKSVDNLNFAPGSEFQYSNPAYNGLALIIEKVAGQKWQDFIVERIFKPSAMQLSTITDGPHPQNGVAHAYVMENGKYKEMDYGETPTFAAAGNGGVWSTVLELASYEDALQDAIFLKPSMVKESRTIYRPDNWSGPDAPFVGYSWWIGEKALLGEKVGLGVHTVQHSGSQGGFRAFFVSIPEKDIKLIGLFNRPVPGLRKLMAESLLVLKKHDWADIP